MKLIFRILFVSILFCNGAGHAQAPSKQSYFPGSYPKTATASVTSKTAAFENDAFKAVWIIENGNIRLKEISNKYDHTIVQLDSIVLFSIQLADGTQLTNRDFTLQGNLSITALGSSDSLPTASLQFPGKRITGRFISKDNNILVHWSAHLRNGSNYLRQYVQVETLHTPVQVNKISFFEGPLKGASYAGSVLGSPIIYQNVFFGLEHPIAHSKALMARTAGSISNDKIDISSMITEAGKYTVAIEHGGGDDDFNINAVSLLENDNVITSQQHVLNGYNGSNLYELNLTSYHSGSHYDLKLMLTNPEKATGTVHLYKKQDDILGFYITRIDTLFPGKKIGEWGVIGVSPPGQLRRSFAYYLERERARPYKQFLHYSCWWDITDDGASSFSSAQFIERMHAWNRKFIKPFGIKLDAFVFDAGWDDPDNPWYFDPVKFPHGFSKEAALCRQFNSGIGVWMSPFGGYLEDKQRRINAAKKQGLETNARGLSLAGPNYSKRFYDRAADMLVNYKVNYFKFDGFGGSEPAFLPDMEAGAQLISKLRRLNHNVYINITVGSWPSPFWLKYADCTWRGSGDLHNAGQGNTSQKFMTYRDGTLHNNIVNRAPFYPLNSIMVAGIAYANLGHPARFITENEDDFKSMVRSFFGAGSSLQELYISHDKMKDRFWPILAEAAKWAKENEDVLKDVHWIGGSPINLEAYGFASWKPGKGIITLRNPSDKPVVYMLDLNRDLALPEKYATDFYLKSPWLDDKNEKEMIINKNTPTNIILKPFEVKVFEVIKVNKR